MDLFSKFYHAHKKFAASDPGSPSSPMTEMTSFSESASRSQHDSDSPRFLSSGSSVMARSTTNSAQSSYSSRKIEKGWIQDINKHNLMAKHLYRNCKKNNWLEDKSNEAVVALRTFQGGYILFPPEDKEEKYECQSNRRFVSDLVRMSSKLS
jgi:hypothetical protein